MKRVRELQLKKNLMPGARILFLLLLLGSAYSKEYVIVHEIKHADRCSIYRVEVWDDNSTPTEASDDYIIAVGYYSNCFESERNAPNNEAGSTKTHRLKKENTKRISFVNLKVFPNPNNGKFKVDLGEYSFSKLMIYEVRPYQTAFQVQKIDTKSDVYRGVISLDFSTLPKGTYQLEFFNETNKLRGYARFLKN